MKQRKFSNTDRFVSEVGLGTWQIGGSWGDVSDADALKILETAAEHNVTFYDTADVYGDGRSEKLLGAFLRTQPTDSIFVATKLGRGASPGWPDNFTYPAMEKHVEASLERLGVDTLDLVQLHCIPTEVLQQGEVFESLRKLQQLGKIKQFGASVESMEEAQICMGQAGLASLQIIFNIFRQKPIKTIFDEALQKQIAIIVRLPLASGLLSGKLTHETQFAPTDHRNFNRDGQSFSVGETFAGLPFDTGVDLADELKPLVPASMTMPQMALRWVLDHEAVTTVIPGASKYSQVLSNVAASELDPLSTQLHEQLSTWYEERVAAHIRGKY